MHIMHLWAPEGRIVAAILRVKIGIKRTSAMLLRTTTAQRSLPSPRQWQTQRTDGEIVSPAADAVLPVSELHAGPSGAHLSGFVPGLNRRRRLHQVRGALRPVSSMTLAHAGVSFALSWHCHASQRFAPRAACAAEIFAFGCERNTVARKPARWPATAYVQLPTSRTHAVPFIVSRPSCCAKSAGVACVGPVTVIRVEL